MTDPNEVTENAVSEKAVTTNPTAPAAAASSPAVLVLEDGRIFRGTSYGATGTALGEAVFATGMTGYQEILTDPSYNGQIVTRPPRSSATTASTPRTSSPASIWVAGFVVGSRPPSLELPCRHVPSTNTSSSSGIVGIEGIDTRALTRQLREHRTMRAGIFSGDVAASHDKNSSPRVLASAPMEGSRLAEEVSRDAEYTVEPKDQAGTASRGSASSPSTAAQAQHPPPPRRARRQGAPSSRHDNPARSSRHQPRRPVRLQRPRRPRRPRLRQVTLDPHVLDRSSRPSASASATSSSAGPSALEHLQAQVRPPRRQPAGDEPRHRPRRNHQPEPRLRRRPSRASKRPRTARRSPTST